MTHSYYKEGCLSSVYTWKNAVVSFHPRIIRTERFKWDKVLSAFFKIVKPSHVVQNRFHFHRSLLKRPFARKLPILRGRENKSAAFPLRTTMKLLRLCPSVSRMKAYKEAATSSLSFSSKTLNILWESVTFLCFFRSRHASPRYHTGW